ncbi:MAG: glutathionylspermidine synthase family protein [Actinophytocola sp.]|uniref:glutathionylspermidine synthase family protein n=1 Tax=Actinophytocola sp. TaxID=1872138 RepID=UPI003C719AFE
MRRHLADPRPGWERIVTEQGLIFPVTPMPDGTTVPYWNELAWYEFSMTEVFVLEAATEELWAMCLDAAGYLAATATDKRLGLPAGSLDLIRESIRRGDQAVYARFDLAPTGTDLATGSPVRMLEINGDTPTGLVETGVAQWRWVEEVMPGTDQWNSVHDRLVRRWRDLATSGALDGDRVHFLYLHPDLADDAGEMEMTVHYMLDCALQAGLRPVAQPIDDVGWDRDRSAFVDRAGNEIRNAFKLYPWETMLGERFGRMLLDRAEVRPVNWFEPAWKALLSTKAILPVLWERNPGHPLLLPAYFDGPGELTEWVAKPLHGREGDNIRIHRSDQREIEMPGDYGAEGWVYQAYTPLPVLDGNHVVLGSWIVDGEAAGMLVRESDGPVTDYFSRVVPHAISDAASPDAEQTREWLVERTTQPRVPVLPGG